MRKYLFGEIVILKFPFADGHKNKRRPALILSDTEDGDAILCRITSKIYNTEFDFKIENWKEKGLKLPSVIRLHKIASLEITIIEQSLGTLSEEMKDKLKIKFSELIR